MYKMSSHPSEFQTPVDCAEERKQDGTIANLNGLQHGKPMLRSLGIEKVR
jgi:hypothetical protein